MEGGNETAIKKAAQKARMDVRFEFTTPHGKHLRGTSLPHGMENTPTHLAPVESAMCLRRIYGKEKLRKFRVQALDRLLSEEDKKLPFGLHGVCVVEHLNAV